MSPQQAEAISEYGDERTKRKEEERVKKREKGGDVSLIAAII